MSNTIVQVENFGKKYKRLSVIDNVSLSVGKGEIHGLIGPDGSGKSSLLKAIAGVLDFDQGVIRVFGINVNSEKAAEKIKGRIGFMPQGLGQNLYAELSVEENIDFFAQLRRVPQKVLETRKARLLEMTRLEQFKGRSMKHLSGGMKQKLGLVCSLIHHPELVILDEPTTGVDPVSRRDFWVILSQLLEEFGITAVVSTAYMDEASRFHRVSLMYNGKLFAQGRPEEIRALASGSVVIVRALPQAEAFTTLKARYPQVQPIGHHLRVFVRDKEPGPAEEIIRNSLSDVQLEECYSLEPELEDVFVALLAGRNGHNSTGPGITVRKTREIKAGEGSDPAIWAKDLVQDFGAFRAVDRLSFEVPQGEIFGLLGANGAGKTTAIKMLAGILPPSSGDGRVAGIDMRKAVQSIKSRVGYMSQAFSLYEDLTALENLRLYGGIYGLSGGLLKERIAETLALTDLQEHGSELTQGLPMGVRQRLALACALLHRPSILFLDEPTSGVDPLGRRRFWEILFHLSREKGVTILVTTHYMNEAEHCDHLVLMYAGCSVADATPAEMKRALQEEAGDLLELTVDRPMPVLELLASNGFGDAAIFGNCVHLLTHSIDETISGVRLLLESNGLPLHKARKIPLSMEDVFVYRVTALEQHTSEGQLA